MIAKQSHGLRYQGDSRNKVSRDGRDFLMQKNGEAVTAVRTCGKFWRTTQLSVRCLIDFGNRDILTLSTSITHLLRLSEVMLGHLNLMLAITDSGRSSDFSQVCLLGLNVCGFTFTNPLIVTSVVWGPKYFRYFLKLVGPISPPSEVSLPNPPYIPNPLQGLGPLHPSICSTTIGKYDFWLWLNFITLKC